MPELRRDYFSNRLSIIPTERTRRPREQEARQDDGVPCSCCPGNESMTPPAELVLVQKEGSLAKLVDSDLERVKDWVVRVFPSREPAVALDASSSYGDPPLYSEPATGYHYIAVATPAHSSSFADIDVEQWFNVLTAVQDMTHWLYGRKGVAFVSTFIDQRMEAGRPSSHACLHMVTLPKLPPLIEEEALTVQKSISEQGVCPMCTVVKTESSGPRQILATEHHTAFCPWAPTQNHEFWIFPKKHQTSMLKVGQKEVKDLALILRATLGGMHHALGAPPFGLAFHTSTEKKITRQIHWRIEVYPQTAPEPGFERGAGVYLCSISPEQSATVLGAGARRELARLVGVSDT